MKELDERISSGIDFLKIFRDATLSTSSKIITFVNPFSYEQLRNEKKLINNLDYFFSDGALLCFFNNVFKKRKITRASFDYSSIANDVLQFASKNDMKVAIIGATDKELEVAVKTLKSQHKCLNVTYYRNGYFKSNDEMFETAKKISTLELDLALVGMGTPYQEEFSVLIKDNAVTPIVILTCGGFLTQTSIRADYYFPLIKKLGLRWLQRIVMHKHVRDRVLKDYPIFIYNYIKANFFK